jgi:hypothetical protein
MFSISFLFVVNLQKKEKDIQISTTKKRRLSRKYQPPNSCKESVGTFSAPSIMMVLKKCPFRHYSFTKKQEERFPRIGIPFLFFIYLHLLSTKKLLKSYG